MGVQFIVHNWRLKVVALLVACGMWVAVVYAGNPPAIRTIYIPVQVNGLRSAQVVLVDPVHTVPVRIDGVLSNVTDSLVSPHLSASVNLHKLTRPGEYQLPLKFDNSDPNVGVLSVPSSVQVVVDVWKTEALPVHVDIEDQPPNGFKAGLPTASPSSVKVRAPSSILPHVVVEAKVNLSPYRANATVPVTVSLVNGDSLAHQATADPSLVTVKVDIRSTSITEGATVVVATTGNVPAGYQLVSVRPTPVSIDVTGPEANLTYTISTTSIDLSNISRDTTVQEPLDVPSGETSSVTSVTVAIVVEPLPGATPTPAPTPTPTPTPSP
jgi:YbbR domain-containing protein